MCWGSSASSATASTTTTSTTTTTTTASTAAQCAAAGCRFGRRVCCCHRCRGQQPWVCNDSQCPVQCIMDGDDQEVFAEHIHALRKTVTPMEALQH
jgi:dienelactone hydrolase